MASKKRLKKLIKYLRQREEEANAQQTELVRQRAALQGLVVDQNENRALTHEQAHLLFETTTAVLMRRDLADALDEAILGDGPPTLAGIVPGLIDYFPNKMREMREAEEAKPDDARDFGGIPNIEGMGPFGLASLREFKEPMLHRSDLVAGDWKYEASWETDLTPLFLLFGKPEGQRTYRTVELNIFGSPSSPYAKAVMFGGRNPQRFVEQNINYGMLTDEPVLRAVLWEMQVKLLGDLVEALMPDPETGKLHATNPDLQPCIKAGAHNGFGTKHWEQQCPYATTGDDIPVGGTDGSA